MSFFVIYSRDRRDIPSHLREISLQLQSVHDLVQAVECVLLLLDLTEEQEQMHLAEPGIFYRNCICNSISLWNW